MEPSKLFEDKAEIYAKSRPLYPEPLFEYIAALTGNRDKAWDCATGNGQAALGLTQYFTHVLATDISREQIKYAFSHDRIKYSVQPSESTQFRDNQFDLVNVAQALHWFHPEPFWKEVQRVLKPSGAFVTYTYAWSKVTHNIDKAVQESVLNVIEPFWAQNVKSCWNGYRTMVFPFEKLPVPKIELKNNWDLDEYLNYIHSWSGTRACMKANGMAFFEVAREKISTVWGDTKEKKSIITPLTVIAGKAWT